MGTYGTYDHLSGEHYYSNTRHFACSNIQYPLGQKDQYGLYTCQFSISAHWDTDTSGETGTLEANPFIMDVVYYVHYRGYNTAI